MRTHYTNEISVSMDGKEVIVAGWAREIRSIGKLIFVKLVDNNGFVQITAKAGNLDDRLLKQFKELGRESVIEIKGKVSKNKEAPNGFELLPEQLTVLNTAEQPIPLDIEAKRTPAMLDTRLDWRPLDLRNPKNSAVFKIQAKIIETMQQFLNKQGFVQVYTPSLLGGASEGGADLFSVPYFDKEAFLRQDPQLHRELLICGGLEKIYDIGPSWRAEKSHTNYHLAEHRTCAPEIAFIKDETDVMKLEETLIVEIFNTISKECKEQLEILDTKFQTPKTPFPELRFPKIYDILEELGKKLPENADLNRETEELLAGWVKEKHKNDFYFVNRFPFAVKPFYVARVDDEPEYARSVDLIYKGLEQSSGGQREHRHAELIKNIREKRLNLKNLEWFVQHFKYGAPPMGGFSIGIERLTMKLLDLPNVREAVLFPRTPERLIP